MKRKILIIASVVLLCAASAFADKETDLNIYITPFEKYYYVGDDADGCFRQTFAFGLEGQWGFIFGAPSENFEMGLNLSYGIDMMVGYSYDYWENSNHYFGETKAFGMNMHTNLGPVFKINIGDMHSIWLSPGIKLGFGFGVPNENVDDDGFVVFNLALAMDVGYRLWVTDSFGISTGVDLSVDMVGFFGLSRLSPGGLGINIYLGICFK